MSRIEKALEKASQLRNVNQVETEPRPLSAVPAAAPSVTSAKAAGTVQIKADNLFLKTLNEPNSAVSEEYRKLKSNLVKLTKGDTFDNVIMVTSAVASEGKSITAINLAISLAQEFDHTVLLIDADLRRPSIHKYLDLDATLGLADCLMDGVDIGDTIINTGVGSLSIIPAGQTMANPLEFFTSQKMQALISDIKHRYPDRYIIIDTPPFLPFAETQALSQLVDGVVFVVKEGLASAESVTEALEALKDCNLLGVVFNEATISPLDNRYYDYHYSREAYQTPLSKDGSKA